MQSHPLPQPNSWHNHRAVITGTRIAFWGVLQFALHMIEQVAELLAPLLFVAGAVWWGVLRVIGAVQLEDGQIQKIVQRFPTELLIQGHMMTPGRVIRDGLLLMALVAACRTAHAIIAKET